MHGLEIFLELFRLVDRIVNMLLFLSTIFQFIHQVNRKSYRIHRILNHNNMRYFFLITCGVASVINSIKGNPIGGIVNLSIVFMILNGFWKCSACDDDDDDGNSWAKVKDWLTIVPRQRRMVRT